jgi:hypothetical protein
MRTILLSILLSILLASTLVGCGDGQWGAELQLTLVGAGDQTAALSPGDTLTLPDGQWTVSVDRACLSVETVVVTPEAGAAPEGGEDCFCHGDPPHCHGDCGEEGSAAERPVVVAVHAVVDLLAGPTQILAQGVSPGDYLKVAFAFSESDTPASPPPSCAQMDGRTFWLEGTLTHVQTQNTWDLTVDIRADDKITDVAQADPPAAATSDDPAILHASVRVDLVLAHVDFAAVTQDASGPITIGGPTLQHILSVGSVVEGLTDAESLGVTSAEAP